MHSVSDVGSAGSFDGSDLNSIEVGWQVILVNKIYLDFGYTLKL